MHQDDAGANFLLKENAKRMSLMHSLCYSNQIKIHHIYLNYCACLKSAIRQLSATVVRLLIPLAWCVFCHSCKRREYYEKDSLACLPPLTCYHPIYMLSHYLPPFWKLPFPFFFFFFETSFSFANDDRDFGKESPGK